MATVFPIQNDASGVNSTEQPFAWTTLSNNFARLRTAVNDLAEKAVAATASVAGLIKKATQAQAVAGTADDAALTPLAARASTAIAARAAGGLAYQDMLGLPAPSKSLRALAALEAANGIPAGWTFTRASALSQLAANGLLVSRGSGVVAHPYNVDGTYRGVAVYPGRTNILLHPEDISNAAWTKGNATVTANAATAPDGATTADKLVESATVAQHYVSQSAAGTVAQQWTLTFYAKAGERSQVQAWLADAGGSGNRVQAIFDLATGQASNAANAGAGAGVVASMEALPGGWWRCRLTGQPNTSGTSVYGAMLLASALANSYQGDGASGLYLWGAQLEAGLYPSPYIPTTTAAVTRAADVLSVAVGDWYHPSEGTVICEFDAPAYQPAEYRMAWSLGQSVNDIIRGFVYSSTAGLQIRVANAYTLNLSRPITSERVIMAATWKSGFAAIMVNGQYVEGVPTGLPTGITTLYAGSQAGNFQLGGAIKLLDCLPRALSAAQLQEVGYAA